jgi:hypothetical protein
VNTDFETTLVLFHRAIAGVSPELPNKTFQITVVNVHEFPPVIVSNGVVPSVLSSRTLPP